MRKLFIWRESYLFWAKSQEFQCWIWKQSLRTSSCPSIIEAHHNQAIIIIWSQASMPLFQFLSKEDVAYGDGEDENRHIIIMINPLSPNINIHILPTLLLTSFFMLLVGRIWLKIKTFWSLVTISFILVTCKFEQVLNKYCKEKLDAWHYWGLKGCQLVVW